MRQKLARAALQAKDLATARVVLEAIPDEKQTPKSLLMLANINEESSDFQAAIECYRNIARLEPDGKMMKVCVILKNLIPPPPP